MELNDPMDVTKNNISDRGPLSLLQFAGVIFTIGIVMMGTYEYCG